MLKFPCDSTVGRLSFGQQSSIKEHPQISDIVLRKELGGSGADGHRSEFFLPNRAILALVWEDRSLPEIESDSARYADRQQPSHLSLFPDRPFAGSSHILAGPGLCVLGLLEPGPAAG
jgi:hypothetical protein